MVGVWGKGITHRVIRLASLGERLGRVVDLLNHFRKVLVQLVEAVLELLGQLVRALTFLVCASETV